MYNIRAETFRALVVDSQEQAFSLGIKRLSLSDLPVGEVLIKVIYSGLNYKDALVCCPDGKVARRYPLVPGMEIAGVVVESDSTEFNPGDQVMAGDYNEIGISRHGGFSEYARVPARLLYSLPEGFTLKESIAIGGNGLSALLALRRLEQNGLKPENGPVLITGATGGVGSLAVSLFSQRGYRVAASSGKATESDYLKELGASEIISREEAAAVPGRPLEAERWAGSVDTVGGATLAYLSRTTKKGGSIAAIGLTGGAAFQATVYPFILRGINLLGIDMPSCPKDLRQELWKQLAESFELGSMVKKFAREISLEELPAAVANILKGNIRGRIIVRMDL